MSEPRESAVVVQDDCSPLRLKPRHTRARSGCERCRAHRRKCDEEKPRCKRCDSAGAVCKYVTHVSFKSKNSQTLSNGPSPDHIAVSASPKRYHTIEFIFDDGPSQASPSNNGPQSTDADHLGNQGCSTNVSQRPSNQDLDEGGPPVGSGSLSSIEVELLKYYSHHVAPWLDVYDQDQAFGHCVTRLAMNSPCVLERLLQLSAISSGRPVDIITRRGAGIFQLQTMSNPPGAESPFEAVQMIACFVLARAQLFVDRIPDTWKRSLEGDGAVFYFRRFSFFDTAQKQMWLGFLTLLLRLETAYCLMNQQPPVWVPELAHQIQIHSGANSTSDNKSQQTLNSSLQCLGILVDTMSLSFLVPGTSDAAVTLTRSKATITSGTCGAENGKDLMDRLYAWQEARPSNLEPLLEVEKSEGIFPVVIFPSRAGISANILYHTAMFLILSNKLYLASFDNQHTHSGIHAAQLSPHWHALRVCAIAINSESDYSICCDPVIIAAFSLAAQQMTHSSQHNEILRYLNQLKAAGLHIDSLINKLRDGWKSIS
ncbi:hypothetical protein GGS24DRAFT_256313 [Hypoxylon argillaceum]|nr:hypothetical protein GGS24DRAFT_256313 [Hypoxylon argillaceum]